MSEQDEDGKDEHPHLPRPENTYLSLDYVELAKNNPVEYKRWLHANNERNQGIRLPCTAERPFPLTLPPPLRRRPAPASPNPPKKIESTPKDQQKRRSDFGLGNDSDGSEYLTSAAKNSPFGGTPIDNSQRRVTRSQKGKSSIGSEPTNTSKDLSSAAPKNDSDEDDDSEDDDNDNTASPSARKGKEKVVETGGKTTKKTLAAQAMEDVVLNNNTPSYCGTSAIPNDILKLCKKVRNVLGDSLEFTRQARAKLGKRHFSSDFTSSGFIISQRGSPSRLWHYWMDDRLFQAQDWRNLATWSEKPYPKELVQAGVTARAYSASVNRSNPYPAAKIQPDATQRAPTPGGNWTSPFLRQQSSDNSQQDFHTEMAQSPTQDHQHEEALGNGKDRAVKEASEPTDLGEFQGTHDEWDGWDPEDMAQARQNSIRDMKRGDQQGGGGLNSESTHAGPSYSRSARRPARRGVSSASADPTFSSSRFNTSRGDLPEAMASARQGSAATTAAASRIPPPARLTEPVPPGPEASEIEQQMYQMQWDAYTAQQKKDKAGSGRSQ
ncbi:hypothetical protein AC579_6155 [Pseudocercospora musae]|uniref:Uncharacterized protein n=1 Tax=Pseudocercospora musae TaxID=113226 RepID=A0A139I4T9_9PEZI|nr:hypothetical protein AC579_6155 [Pseudocercospora musae]